MAAKRDPKNSWEQTYGYTNPDGRFAPGERLKKEKEIDRYFKNADHPPTTIFGISSAPLAYWKVARAIRHTKQAVTIGASTR